MRNYNNRTMPEKIFGLQSKNLIFTPVELDKALADLERARAIGQLQLNAFNMCMDLEDEGVIDREATRLIMEAGSETF